MKKNNYLFYSDFLNDKKIKDETILIAKTKKSYIIGPLINEQFNIESFYKRIISNSIYSPKIYKKMLKRKCIQLIQKYNCMLHDNEVIEVFKNGKIIYHKIITVPGDEIDKK